MLYFNTVYSKNLGSKWFVNKKVLSSHISFSLSLLLSFQALTTKTSYMPLSWPSHVWILSTRSHMLSHLTFCHLNKKKKNPVVYYKTVLWFFSEKWIPYTSCTQVMNIIICFSLFAMIWSPVDSFQMLQKAYVLCMSVSFRCDVELNEDVGEFTETGLGLESCSQLSLICLCRGLKGQCACLQKSCKFCLHSTQH